MKSYIRPPFLTTSFSEDGKRAKKRFENILNTRAKRLGTVFIVIAVIACTAIGAVVTVGQKGQEKPQLPDKPQTLARQLFDTKHPYVGDAAANGETLRALGIGTEIGSYTVELQTSSEPYGLILHFDDRGTLRRNRLDGKMENYAKLILALTDNLGYVQWDYPYRGGKPSSAVYSDDSIKAIGKSAEAVEAYLEEINYSEEILTSIKERLTDTDIETFKRDALVINDDGSAQNIQKLNEFLNLVTMDSVGILDIVHYNSESGTALIRVQSDGTGFYCGERDINGDAQGEYHDLGKYRYLKIFRDGAQAQFELLNDASLTQQDIFSYLLDSSIPDYMPEFFPLFTLEEGEKYAEAIY